MRNHLWEVSMSIKTKVQGTSGKKLSSSFSGMVAGRPTSKDIVSHHKAANIKNIGYTKFGHGTSKGPEVKGGVNC
jgi:hypothetical protein